MRGRCEPPAAVNWPDTALFVPRLTTPHYPIACNCTPHHATPHHTIHTTPHHTTPSTPHHTTPLQPIPSHATPSNPINPHLHVSPHPNQSKLIPSHPIQPPIPSHPTAHPIPSRRCGSSSTPERRSTTRSGCSSLADFPSGYVQCWPLSCTTLSIGSPTPSNSRLGSPRLSGSRSLVGDREGRGDREGVVRVVGIVRGS